MSRRDSAPSLRRIQLATTVCLALACSSESPSAPYEFAVVPPLVVDDGAVPGGLLAVTYAPESGPTHIYTVRPDGSGLTQLTPDDHLAVSPAWSPDGARVAYQRLGDAYVGGIWVIGADGSGAVRIAPGGSSPFWLDDARVGFGCAAGICVVGADGSSPATLIARTPPPGTTEDSFTLSPDGASFAFVRGVRNALGVMGQIYVMKRDGTGERALTGVSPLKDEAFPSWSSDSKRIAFNSSSLGIAVADVESRSAYGVSHRGEIMPDIGAGGPAWSPDGTRIVFGVDARRFYIANADGSGVIRRVNADMPPSSYTWAIAQWSWTPR